MQCTGKRKTNLGVTGWETTYVLDADKKYICEMINDECKKRAIKLDGSHITAEIVEDDGPSDELDFDKESLKLIHTVKFHDAIIIYDLICEN